MSPLPRGIFFFAACGLLSSRLLAAPLRGDVDGDQQVNLTDAIDVLGYLFLGAFKLSCEPVADSDADGQVLITDAIRILYFLFLGGSVLPELTAEELDACTNKPPSVPARGVYRTYPGFPIEFAIGATDPEGGAMCYTVLDGPQGAELGEGTGLVRWTPGPDQLGPAYLRFTVADDGSPPTSVEGRLAFQVLPLDGCVELTCEPSGGCEATLRPLGEDCCAGDGPATRVPEPDAGCPEGRVLHVGRNVDTSQSIGRLWNCDQVRLVPLGQGGHVLRLHLEARCIAPEALVRARLETIDAVLFDQVAERDFQPRADGYLQAIGLGFVAEGRIIDGSEASLSVTVTDASGASLARELRVVITRSPVEDLP